MQRAISAALRVAKRPPSTWLLVGVDAEEGVPSAWNLPEMLSLVKVGSPLLSAFSHAVSGTEVPVRLVSKLRLGAKGLIEPENLEQVPQSLQHVRE